MSDATSLTADIVAELESTIASFRREVSRQKWSHFLSSAANIPPVSLQLYTVISAIDAGPPCRLSDIARSIDVDPSTASRHVQQLIDQGLVEASADPTDRRAVLHALTPRGSEIVAAIRTARRALFTSILSSWPEHDQRELLRLFRTFVHDLSEAQGACTPHEHNQADN